MNRREFLKNTTLLSAMPFLNKGIVSKATLPGRIGIQLFSLPNMLEDDFSGTLAMLSDIGYTEIEMFGPYSFSGGEGMSEALVPLLGFKESGFFRKSIQEVNTLMKAYGLTVPSLHTDYDTLLNNMGVLAEAAHQLGSKYVVLPSMPAERRKTPDDLKRVANDFNKMGSEARKYGVYYAYHNHGYGLNKVNGRMPLDTIFEDTDPSTVFFQIDVFWTTAGGGDPVELLKEHAGRYKMIHLKDMIKKSRFSGDGGDPFQWIELFPQMCSAGDGILDLPTIVATAKSSGVEHFLVEQDLANSEIALKKSFDYLSKLI